MKTGFSFLMPALLCSTLAFAQGNAAAAPQNANRPAAIQSPIVLPDGRVTFNLRAPNAVSVTLAGDYPLVGNFHGGTKTTNLIKGENGVWSVTVGPLKPDIYNYAFDVDGTHALDPQNVHVSRSSAAARVTNWVIVPGPESANFQVNDVPHGRLSEVWYTSPMLKMQKR